MIHRIEVPKPDDAEPLGSVQLRAWLQTCPNAEAGIDAAWIHEQRGHSATAEGTAQWREFIEAAALRPDLLYCRVVRSDRGITGFLCGRRDEVVTLGPMYLLDEAQGLGLSGRMMDDFLAWADGAPVHLWVTDYNQRAIRFYERHGFTSTDEHELWRDRLPNVRMVRGAGGRQPGIFCSPE